MGLEDHLDAMLTTGVDICTGVNTLRRRMFGEDDFSDEMVCSMTLTELDSFKTNLMRMNLLFEELEREIAQEIGGL